MLQSKTLSISIPADWTTVYEAIWSPEHFPRWASGLSRSSLHKVGDHWQAEGPEGPITIRFTDHNSFGVMDHTVDLGGGVRVYLPMRVVANEAGCEVLFTLYRQATMSDETFADDAAWVERDLQALKALFTG